MKKYLFVICFAFTFNVFFSQAEFSGSIGASFFIGQEQILNERVVMDHQSVGVSANLYFISKINLGLWMKFDYLFPYKYILQKEDQNLTYAFTEAIDFSIGPAYIFKINESFAINTALGFNIIQMVIDPRISTSYGISADIAFRYSFLPMFSLNVGSSFTYSFFMHLMSDSKQYNHYSLLSFRPYISFGWVAPLDGKEKLPPKQELDNYTLTSKNSKNLKVDNKIKLLVNNISNFISQEKIENMSVKPTDTGVVIIADKIKFQRGKTILFNSEEKKIMMIADILNKNSDAEIAIVTYVENEGKNISQIELTKERSNSIKENLIELEVSNNIKTLGSEIPIIKSSKIQSSTQEINRLEVYIIL
ncbi:MAG: hypothetical protein ACRC5H_05265 [Treponemataceae bacterium]